MISETEWKFFEATEQRIKHLHRHQEENFIALATGDGSLIDPDGLAEKQASIVQEMEYPARVETALAGDATPAQARHLDLHRRWILGTLFETHPEISPLLHRLRERLLRGPYPERPIREVLRHEPDRDQRESAWNARVGLAQELQPDVQTLIRSRETLARAVLDSGYPHIAHHVLDQERTAMIALLDEFERTTRKAYFQTRRALARRMELRDLEPWDLDYGLQEWGGIGASAFGAEDAVAAAEIQARRWGFEPRGLPIRIQSVEAGDGTEEPAGWTVAVEIPGDIRILCPLDSPGYDGYRNLFFHYGCALHYAHIGSRRHFLERESQLMAFAVGEVFEAVTREPEWLEEQTGLSGSVIDTFLEAQRAARLIRLRLHHAHNSFENIVYAHSDQDPHRLHGEVFEQGLGFSRAPLVRWAAHPDYVNHPFRHGSLLAGAIVGARTTEKLEELYPRWWQHEEVGPWLVREVATEGAAVPWAEKVERSTGSPPDVGALSKQLGVEAFAGPVLEEAAGGLSDDGVEEYFKDIDLSDLDTDA